MRLIDADELKEVIKANHYLLSAKNNSTDYGMFTTGIMQAIDNAPTVSIPNCGGQVVPDVLQGWRYEERPQGEWIYNQYDENARIGNWHCSFCHNICYEMKLAHDNYNFCPNCGAEMETPN